MTDKVEVAVAKFMSGYNCAQAVLFAYCDALGNVVDISGQTVFRAAITMWVSPKNG